MRELPQSLPTLVGDDVLALVDADGPNGLRRNKSVIPVRAL